MAQGSVNYRGGNLAIPQRSKSPGQFGALKDAFDAEKDQRSSLGSPQAYQGGLQTEFSGTSGFQGGRYAGARSLDSDVLSAQNIENQNARARAGQDSGVDFASQNALLNMYKGRIQTKNALAESIAGNEGLRKDEISSVYGEAGAAAKAGTKRTRENFNARGLLYSGGREGGENAVRSAVGSKMASDISNTNRESAKALSTAKNAYASVGLQNAQESLKLADEAMTTSSKNNIARLQAYQQMYSGIGQVAGSIYGSYSKQSPVVDNSSGVSPSNMQRPME